MVKVKNGLNSPLVIGKCHNYTVYQLPELLEISPKGFLRSYITQAAYKDLAQGLGFPISSPVLAVLKMREREKVAIEPKS